LIFDILPDNGDRRSGLGWLHKMLCPWEYRKLRIFSIYAGENVKKTLVYPHIRFSYKIISCAALSLPS
jgi:hypothetical protein